MSQEEGKLKNTITPEQLKQSVDPEPLVRKLRKDLKTAKSRIEQMKLQIGKEEDFFLLLKDALTVLDPQPLKYQGSKKPGTVTHPVSAVLQFSDWHIGEVVDADEIEGFNAFNYTIATERVKHIVSKFIDWVKTQRATSTIDECVVVCNGDMITGGIHHELEVTNEFTVPEQVTKAAELFTTACSMLATEFKSLRIEYVTADNHSRLTHAYQCKQGGKNSYNYIVGWIAERMLENHNNIEFNLHPVIKELITIQKTKYLVQHGHGIKGWAGLPWYGIERQNAKEAQARMMTNKGFHKMILGHFHTPINTPDFIMGGSLSGMTEYDRSCGRSGKPCQVGWMVHPKFGEFNFNVFYPEHWGA
jgi:hypothetical protein